MVGYHDPGTANLHRAFGIFHAGYGPDNFAPFAEAFRGLAAEVSGAELSETEEATDSALDRVDVPPQDERGEPAEVVAAEEPEAKPGLPGGREST